MENYEEKYKLSLERAKAYFHSDGNYNDYTDEMLLEIFPELKESDDERIRKELLEHCINRRDGKQICVDASDYRRWAAWLEKQKCNKTIKFSEEDEKTRLWIVHVLCECGYKFNDNGERENAFELLEKIKQIICNGSLEKQGEKKPVEQDTEKSCWKPSEEQLNSLGRFIEGVYGCVDFTNIKSLYNDLKTL